MNIIATDKGLFLKKTLFFCSKFKGSQVNAHKSVVNFKYKEIVTRGLKYSFIQLE